MDCEKFDRVVLDLLYQELDSLTTSAAARHMEHCARCRKIGTGLRATRNIGKLPIAPLPERLELEVLEVERETAEHLPMSQRLERSVSVMAGYAMRPQLAMGALLLLLIGSSLLLLRAQPGTPERAKVDHGAEGDPESIAVVPREGVTNSTDRAFGNDDANLEAAWAAYHAGRYTEAQQRAEPISRSGGEHSPQATLLLAQALRRQSGCRAALARFEELRQRHAGTETGFEATWQTAECYRTSGDRDLARRAYETLVTQPGFRERAKTALADLTPDPHGAPSRAPNAPPHGAKPSKQ